MEEAAEDEDHLTGSHGLVRMAGLALGDGWDDEPSNPSGKSKDRRQTDDIDEVVSTESGGGAGAVGVDAGVSVCGVSGCIRATAALDVVGGGSGASG